MKTFPATLFDYNGVLIDDEAVHLAAFQAVLKPLGIEVDEAIYWARYIGFDDAGAFSAILGDAGRSVELGLVRSLIDAKRPVYLKLAEESLRGFPRARELLELRAKAGPVCIVSGALRDEIELGLRFLDARRSVDHIVSAEDTTRSKPDPEGYQLGLEFLETRLSKEDAQRALVIEDSLAGIRAAKALGLTCVAVAHSYPANELLEAGADACFETLAEVSEAALSDLYLALRKA